MPRFYCTLKGKCGIGETVNGNIYVYVYGCVCVCVCVYIYIYIYFSFLFLLRFTMLESQKINIQFCINDANKFEHVSMILSTSELKMYGEGRKDLT